MLTCRKEVACCRQWLRYLFWDEKSHACSWEFVTATEISQAAFIATSSSHRTTEGVLRCFPAERDCQAGIWSSSSSLNTGTKILFSSPTTFSLSPASVFYLQHLSALFLMCEEKLRTCFCALYKFLLKPLFPPSLAYFTSNLAEFIFSSFGNSLTFKRMSYF